MSEVKPVLHILVGKICAGKSTLAQKLASEYGTINLSEDIWLASLYGDQMKKISDYVRLSAILRATLKPYIVDLLNNGMNVVLDFPANTMELRFWYREIIAAANCSHKMHVLDLPDEICLQRLHERNAADTHPAHVTDEQFWMITRHFNLPTEEEGFNLEYVKQ